MTAQSDAQLVSGVLGGDRDAFAQVYDRYADRLHDFAYSMLRHREDAADAVADAFVTTAERLEQLHDPERLRPWLYAVVRRECLRRITQRSRRSYGGDEDLLDLPDRSAAPEAVVEQESLRALVWEAAGGLNERDRAMLDLHLRQGLEGAELGAAMGMSADNAYVGMSRLRDQVERSIGALLVARTSAHECGGLDGVLGDWDGDFTPLVRKRVARHVDRCPVCSVKRAALASPAALLAGVPAFAAPVLLRDRVLEDPRLLSALSSRPGGGGAAADPPPVGGAGPGRRGTRVASIAALVALLVALAGVVRWQQQETDRPAAVAEDTARASQTAPTTQRGVPAQTTTQVTPTLSPSGEPALEVTPSPTTTPAPEVGETATEKPAPSGGPGPEAPPVEPSASPAAPGLLVASPLSLDLGASGTLRLTLSNRGGRAVSFDLAPGQSWLSVSPGSGRLDPGRSRTVTVSADRAALPEGASLGSFAVAWNRGSIPVTVTASRETPPTIGAVSVVRSACGNGGRTAYLAVPVDDESGVDSASVSWSGAGTSGRVALELSGTVWAGAIGPFAVGGPVQLEVVATDTRGNRARRASTIDVAPCPP